MSLWRAYPLATAGGAVVAFVALVAVFAPWLAPYDPNAMDTKAVLMPPSAAHPLGTDALGRDVLARLIYGARVSLLVGFVATGVSVAIGAPLGLVAGYFGGRVDAAIMRLADMMLSFPTFFLILAVIAFLEPSIWNVMLVIGATSWMGVARLVRAEILSLRAREFVLAAEALGVPPARLMRRHLLPNAAGPLLVSTVLGVAGAVLIESGLSFLGLGVQPPTPSWGNMLTEGKDYVAFAWWLTTFPGLAILVTVLGLNLLGEGLRDWLDPRTRR